MRTVGEFMRLQDEVAIITGGGSGIGRGIAKIFAKEGASVVVVGRRKDLLDQTIAQINQEGGVAVAMKGDVSNSLQVTRLIEKVVSDFGKVNILVNNAGVYVPNDAAVASEQEWDTVMSVDLKGVWLCSKACLPYMIKQGRGKIINIASIAGLVGFEGSAAYCAAKGAVINLTREMSLDFGPKNINVNAIAPGVIDTDMTKPFLENEDAKKNFLEKTPVGRIGIPEDIAYAALYLASRESDFVSGHTLVVDGGWISR